MPRRPRTNTPSRRSQALTAIAASTALAAASIQVIGTTGAAAAETTVSTTSVALADALVREDMPTSSFGSVSTLRADASPRMESYLRFRVAGHSGPVTKAVLQVYSYSDSDHGFRAGPVGSAWSESGTTWQTRPATGAVVATTGPTREKVWASLDVTSLVRGDGTVDIALTSGSTYGRAMASREAGTTRAPRLVVVSSATTSPTTATTTPTPTATPTATPGIAPLHVSPGGAGARDGSSWSNAGDLADIPRFVSARPTGGEILVRGDAGPYRHAGSISIKAGGATSSPVVIRGVDAQGAPTVRPLVIGTRTAPYSSTGVDGGEVFKLYSGAKNLVFSNLAFQNEGTVFNAGGNASNITISDVTATNVRRFFTNYLSSGETTANVSQLTLRRITVAGFSKSVLRLQNDSRAVLVEDVHGDSQRQDGDDFAMGVHLGGTVHDVVLRRVTMNNAHDSLHTYWNGDGFATERGVSDIRFEDTLASGNTDGGYDLKSTRTTLVNARAEDNKRNFRFWAADTKVIGCTGLDPHKRGGSSSQTQVWAGANAVVSLSGCTLTDASPSTIVFDLETGARVTATTTTVVKSPSAKLKRLASGSSLVLS